MSTNSYYPIPGLGEINSPNHQRLVKFFHRKCAYCSDPLKGMGHRDHYWPKSWNHDEAVDHASNVVPACGRCNEMKSSSAPWKFEKQWAALGFVPNPALGVWRDLDDDRRQAWDTTYGTDTPSELEQHRAEESAHRDKPLPAYYFKKDIPPTPKDRQPPNKGCIIVLIAIGAIPLTFTSAIIILAAFNGFGF